MASNGDGAIRRDQTLDLQRLVDSAPCLIHTGRPDGYLDFFNETWLKYVGRPLADLQGWNWTAFIHPEDVEAIVEKWRASLACGEPLMHEARVLRADGEYRWMLHHKVAVRGGRGEIVKWHGWSVDIEDRKRAEGQLRRSTEELQRADFYLAEGQRLSHMASWALNPAGFEYWSPELFRMHGLDPARKPPGVQEFLDCVYPQDRESMADLINGLSAQANHFDTTKRIVRSDGEVRHIRWVGVPVVENESLKKYLGSALDVTEHELAIQELRRREVYLAEAQKLSHTGSFGWKPDSGEIVWSDETYRIFEYDRTEQPTLDMVFQRIHLNDRGIAQQVIEGVSSSTDFEHEYRLVIPGGAIKHIHVRAHALPDSSGNIEVVGAVSDVTARKIAEDKIRRLIDAGILGIYIGNTEGEIFEPNQAFLEMLQYDRRDLVSGPLRWTDLTPAEWSERDELAVRENLATRTMRPYEKEFFRKDGSRVPVLIGSAMFQNANEGVVFVLDLSEQKRAEEALRLSEAYLAEAQRLSQTGSWAWNPASDNTYYSQECYRLLGFEPLGPPPPLENVIQRIHPDDQAFCRERVAKGVGDKVDFELDYRIVHPDKRVRDIHCICHPVLDQSGDLVELIGTVIDITERKATEEKIRGQEIEFRQILELTPQHVAVLVHGKERIFANQALLNYFGLRLEEWQSRGTQTRVHPDDWERLRWGSQGDPPDQYEARLLRHDGEYRWFLVRNHPLYDEQGQITRLYVAGADIEDRKRAEERLRQENVALREEIDKASMFEEVVGTSRPLKAVLSRIAKVAPTDSTVLITGETGTGKELIARAIHKRSQRSGRPFVSVNCAALAPTLVFSELFGHEKGAFTGATQRRLGRFEMADGGTIFLDEIGELLPDTQAGLLRVVQEREFERVGGGQPVHVDVRVIAATNRDLNAAVANGAFRQDLLYRLNVFPIEMPPLRERKDDILILVEYFVQRYANRAGRNIRLIDQKTLDRLQSYDWPGNIRELQNIIERSIILNSSDVFSVDELWLSKRTSPRASPAETPPAVNVEPRSEREIIEAALAETRGRVSGPSGAAAKLRIPPSTLETRIKALKIDKRRFKFG